MTRDEYIQSIVDEFPPLTDELLERLAMLWRPGIAAVQRARVMSKMPDIVRQTDTYV